MVRDIAPGTRSKSPGAWVPVRVGYSVPNTYPTGNSIGPTRTRTTGLVPLAGQ